MVISYPTFAEFLRERYRDGKRKPADDARALRLQEQTVLGWCSGSLPNTRQRAQIVERLSYQFVERRYAEAAADAGFPPADAHPALRALTTYGRFHAFLRALVVRVSQEGVAQAAGMPATTLSTIMRHESHTLERAALAKFLQALPTIIEEYLGKTLSVRTPRPVIGQYLHACRLQRGEERRAYAKRIGILPDTYNWIESPDEARKQGKGKRAPYARNTVLIGRIINFLRQERERLKISVAIDDEWMYLGAPSPAAVPSGTASRLPAPPAPVMANAVRDRLRTFVAQCGSMSVAARRLKLRRETVRNFLHADGLMRGTAIDRITKALDAVGCSDVAQLPPLAVAASPAEPGTDARLAALELQVANLRALLAPSAPSGIPSAKVEAQRYISPISPERFTQHGDVVGDAKLAAIRHRIQQVCEDLGHLASIEDDASRQAVQGWIAPMVDELHITIEGFGRKYPIAALETLKSQRRFADEFHARFATSDSAATPPDDERREHDPKDRKT